MANNSGEIFRLHLESLLKETLTQKELAKILDVSESSVKSWIGSYRKPTLRKVDMIANRLGCRTLELIKHGSLSYKTTRTNNSHITFCRNLKKYFIEYQCFNIPQKLSLLDNHLSDFALKSYLRKEHYKMPTLTGLDKIANSLHIETFKLLYEEGL